MEDRAPVFMLVGAAMLALLLGALFWIRSGAPGIPESPEPGKVQVKPAGPARGGIPEQRAAAPAKPVPPPPPVAEERAQPPTGTPKPIKETEEGWEFTADDIKASSRKVFLGLGQYRPHSGQEFEVELLLDAPPLESVTLVLAYDPEYLEFVNGSAKSVGRAFRKGIEANADASNGRLAFVQVGTPGQKNVLACSNEKVAVFRMRAKKPGNTTLAPADKGVSFTNGQGHDEEYQVSGGSVQID